MSDQKRTTTDVILSIESKIDKILSYITTQDFMLKNIANRISKLEALTSNKTNINIPSLPETNSLKQEPVNEVDDFIDVSDKINETSVVKRLPGLKEGMFVPSNQVSSPEKKDFTKEISEMGSKVNKKNQYSIIPVQQKVTYQDGTPIAMASVELLINNNGVLETFKKLKTNATGKWINNMPSGEYVIKVFKSKNFNKNEVRIEMAINVPESNDSVRLNDLVASV